MSDLLSHLSISTSPVLLLVCAGSAAAMAFLVDNSVFGSVRVPMLAMPASSSDGGRSFTSHHVCSLRNRLKMIWVDANWLPAKMIKNKPLRDRPHMVLVVPSVRSVPLSTIVLYSISMDAFPKLPYPARRGESSILRLVLRMVLSVLMAGKILKVMACYVPLAARGLLCATNMTSAPTHAPSARIGRRCGDSHGKVVTRSRAKLLRRLFCIKEASAMITNNVWCNLVWHSDRLLYRLIGVSRLRGLPSRWGILRTSIIPNIGGKKGVGDGRQRQPVPA